MEGFSFDLDSLYGFAGIVKNDRSQLTVACFNYNDAHLDEFPDNSFFNAEFSGASDFYVREVSS